MIRKVWRKIHIILKTGAETHYRGYRLLTGFYAGCKLKISVQNTSQKPQYGGFSPTKFQENEDFIPYFPQILYDFLKCLYIGGTCTLSGNPLISPVEQFTINKSFAMNVITVCLFKSSHHLISDYLQSTSEAVPAGRRFLCWCCTSDVPHQTGTEVCHPYTGPQETKCKQIRNGS